MVIYIDKFDFVPENAFFENGNEAHLNERKTFGFIKICCNSHYKH